MPKNTRLVYSDDPKENQRCSRCKNLVSECSCAPEVEVTSSTSVIAVLRMEKSGRGGKTVTVIDRLPRSEKFLKELTKELKKKCGVGGTYTAEGKDGVIEIQGDKRDSLRTLLEKKGIKTKG